jgi:cyclophilin family peptidyl-prolyl cis-trans isomerase
MSISRVCLSAAMVLAGACAPRYSHLTQPALLSRKAPETFRARFETTQGVFVIEVTRAWAPLGGDRFYNLVRGGFYDGARFYRTLPKFVVQFGISSDPKISKAWNESTKINDDPVKEGNKETTVAFAAGGPNTRTTQVFINMADNVRLDALGFAVFGKVISGMEVIRKFYAEHGEGPPRGTGPDQKKIREEGEVYLARDFPKLDRIIKARIVH